MKKYFLFTGAIVSIIGFFTGLVRSLTNWYDVRCGHYVVSEPYSDTYISKAYYEANLQNSFQRWFYIIPLLVLGIACLIFVIKEKYIVATVILIGCNLLQLLETTFIDVVPVLSNISRTQISNVLVIMLFIRLLLIVSITVFSFLPFKDRSNASRKEERLKRIAKLKKEIETLENE